jgi:hypothetical protein
VPLSSTGTIAASFHAVGKYCGVRLKLNRRIKTGIKITGLLFMTNPGRSSSPTDLEGLRILMVSEIGIRGYNSEDCKRGRMWVGQRFLLYKHIENA